MIGFNCLGKMGQLGNQMFQYASLRGIARNKGYNFCIPYHDEIVVDDLGNKLRIELFDPFVMSNVTQLNIQIIDQDRPTIVEEEFNFNQKIFDECPAWVNLQGYFQSEKYFKHIEDEIRQDFTFKNEISLLCKHKMCEIDRPITLHIHHRLDLDYYATALKKFDNNRTVIIFSNDSEWCKKQKLFADDRFFVSEGNSSYTDLCLMSLCTDFIISNSTFSWWGAWISKSINKVVCCPDSKQWSDLIPEEWLIVK